jgi:hypothetical protein
MVRRAGGGMGAGAAAGAGMSAKAASDIAAASAALLPELFVARVIAFYETEISFHAHLSQFYGAIGRADVVARVQNILKESVDRHAGYCIGYERRFGEIPRLPLGKVDTRRAGDDADGLPGFPPLPKGRTRRGKPIVAEAAA